MSFPEREGGPSEWTVDGFLHRQYELIIPSVKDRQVFESPARMGPLFPPYRTPLLSVLVMYWAGMGQSNL